ncbi:Wzz/FepE/Etk N-terminal domain-containing protein [Shewanella aquimarina]|uniref:Wzz/FepE/Etk N-terminal domain-containing protein n=1 Tax=Shewanella aquimarina TaxID=260365 RepID=UPI002014D02B|nr:Wzz/FepE/Etk N-terminal domain-containing protein [Shewanella aquimarina]MCL2910859.1 Wzz/FepE/Etk N-terminal domain-containing protein [Shewanella aquimarina]
MSTEIKNYGDVKFPEMQTQVNQVNDEIDVGELFSVIWQGKWLIIAITAVFALGSVLFALMQPNVYKSEVVLAPASDEQGGGLSALASQFGGLASMAGINIGNSSLEDAQLAIEVIKSRDFITNFIEKHDILVDLMAVEYWDMEQDSVIYKTDDYDPIAQKWVRNVDLPYKPKPSPLEAYEAFSELMNISVAKETGIVTISFEHFSPKLAKTWLEWLVEDINKEMKERDVAEAVRSSKFLNKQISLTNVADIRSILYKLIEEQAKTIMFAEVRDEYVFKTIDPAFVPEEKFKPKRAVISILGTFFGGAISVLFLLALHFNRKRS